MTVTQSGYARQKNDLYETSEWVTRALLRFFRFNKLNVVDPCFGRGKMAHVIKEQEGAHVFGIDIAHYGGPEPDLLADFLSLETADLEGLQIDGFVMNPPYGTQNRTAVAFIKKALELVDPEAGIVAALVPSNIDFGKTRTDLFRDNPHFAAEIVLLDRITWFEPTIKDVAISKKTGKPYMPTPTNDHKWVVWDMAHSGPPEKYYAEMPVAEAKRLSSKRQEVLEAWRDANERFAA
ncbi:MAG: class I SAM-dependent methyltransferase [Pseudomonadota bacterium]